MRYKFADIKTNVSIIPLMVLILCSLLMVAGRAAADDITLAWDPNSESDLAGYRLYVQEGGDDGGYRLLASIPLNHMDPGFPRHTVLDLMPDTQYRFTITAYNLNGDESGLSNTVCVINGQQCAASFSSSNSVGCFLRTISIPSALKTPDPAR